MIGMLRCRIKANCLLHFGQLTMNSASLISSSISIGINSDLIFDSALGTNAIFFAVQFGLGQSKDGKRRRSVSAICFFNFVLVPP